MPTPSNAAILADRQALFKELGERVTATLGDEPLRPSREGRLEEAQHHLDLERILTGADPAPDMEGHEEVASDILANLMHHAIFHGWDFEAALETAQDDVRDELEAESERLAGPGGR